MRIKVSPSSLCPLSCSFSKALLKTSEYLSWLTRFYPAHTSFNLILNQGSDSAFGGVTGWICIQTPPLAPPGPCRRERKHGQGLVWGGRAAEVFGCSGPIFQWALLWLRVSWQPGQGGEAAGFQRRSCPGQSPGALLLLSPPVCAVSELQLC